MPNWVTNIVTFRDKASYDIFVEKYSRLVKNDKNEERC